MAADPKSEGPACLSSAGLFLLLAASSLTVMSGAAIAPALPRIEAAFSGAWQAAFLTKLLLTMPALMIALTAPLGGKILDRFGKRRVLIFGLGLFALAGTTGLWLPQSWTLVALLLGRAVLGLAVALIMVAATTLIGDFFVGENRQSVFGRQAASMSAGGVAFLLLGGLLADLSWRGPFFIYLASLLLIPLAWRLPKPMATEVVEATDAFPWRALLPIYMSGTLLMATFYLIPTQLPFLLTSVVPDSVPIRALLSGLAIASSTATAVVASLNYPKLRLRLGPHRVLATTCGFMAIGLSSAALSPSVATQTSSWLLGYLFVLLGMFIMGFGTGLLMPNLNDWVQAQVTPRLRGKAVGGFVSAMFLGQFLSPILAAPLIALSSLRMTYALAALALVLAASRLAIARPKSRLQD